MNRTKILALTAILSVLAAVAIASAVYARATSTPTPANPPTVGNNGYGAGNYLCPRWNNNGGTTYSGSQAGWGCGCGRGANYVP